MLVICLIFLMLLKSARKYVNVNKQCVLSRYAINRKKKIVIYYQLRFDIGWA